MKISVVICTHNPNVGRMDKVFHSLKQQTLSQELWELIIVDNKSDCPISGQLSISWHQDASIYREEKLGLIHARICGIENAKNEIIVTVDDDTLLFHNYLENVLQIYKSNPELGVIGGRAIPLFEVGPPPWLSKFYSLLAIRDLGDSVIIDKLGDNKITNYPQSAPLLIAPLRSAMLKYRDHYNMDKLSKDLGRKGRQLSSGEDNDINLYLYTAGYSLGYFPQLQFGHIIPEYRMGKYYLAKLNYASSKTWVQVLNKYGICPWKPIPKLSMQLRCIKAWYTYRAWKTSEAYIYWRGACGMFKAFSEIK